MTRASTLGKSRISGASHMARLPFFAGAMALLAACQPGSNPFASSPSTEASAPRAQTSTRIVDRDVEAPQVYQVTDSALWDGRPSLGGVWVASADVKDPERVIMRNPANGKFVIGALFRRERENPGPKLQISSDAAEALGILAGAPVSISVTALRREETPVEVPQTPILDSNESLADASLAPTSGAGAIDAGGIATSALSPAAPKSAPQPAAAPPKPANSKPADPKAAAKTSDAKTPAKADVKADTAPDTIAATATKALDKAAEGAPIQTAAQPASAQPAATTAATAATTLAADRTVQVGIFSIEANAKRAADKIKTAGVPSEIRKGSTNGKDYWSVVSRGDATTLSKIKAAGFADAYMLK